MVSVKGSLEKGTETPPPPLATEAGGTHPTGMHSCIKYIAPYILSNNCLLFATSFSVLAWGAAKMDPVGFIAYLHCRIRTRIRTRTRT